MNNNLLGNKGSFRRNSLIMSSGAIVNIAVTLMVTPIVSRIFNKEQFGVFAIFVSTVAILNILVNGMFPHAFVIPKKERTFLALLSASILLTIIGTIVVFLIIYLAQNWVLNLINGKELGSYALYIPLGVFLMSFYTILNNWNIRRKEFARNVGSNIVSSVTSKGFQVGYGSLVAGNFIGLIYSELILRFISILVMIKTSMFSKLKEASSLTRIEVIAAIKEYIKYPTYILGANLVNTSTIAIPIYILSGAFGIGAVGAFNVANKLLALPFQALGNSISPVYFQRISELVDSDESGLRELTWGVYTKLLILGCLIYGFIFAFGDFLFQLFLGKDWIIAGQIAQVLSIYFIFQMISSPFAKIFWVYKREDLNLKLNIFRAILRIVSIYIGVTTGSLMKAMWMYTIANLIGYLVVNYFVFRITKINQSRIVFTTFMTTIITLGGFALLRKVLNNTGLFIYLEKFQF